MIRQNYCIAAMDLAAAPPIYIFIYLFIIYTLFKVDLHITLQ